MKRNSLTYKSLILFVSSLDADGTDRNEISVLSWCWWFQGSFDS